ncbi:MAG: hypothetical protein V1860_04365 [bacterium]
MEDKLKKWEVPREAGKNGNETYRLPRTQTDNIQAVEQNLEELRIKEAANKETIPEISKTAAPQETKLEKNKEELLREQVRDFFRDIILNRPDDGNREAIKLKLQEIAGIDSSKFDKIIKESYNLRNVIVNKIQAKKLKDELEDIFKAIVLWLKLLFDKKNELPWLTKEAERLTDEVVNHKWETQ